MQAFIGAERMLDRLPTLTHGFWVGVKALLHSLEQMLVLHRVIRRSGPVVHCDLSEQVEQAVVQ
jgi:hypothetical protein